MAGNCLNIKQAFPGGGCKSGLSGIKNLWIGAFGDVATVAPAYPARIGDIDDSLGGPIHFWKFPLPIDLGDATEEVTADPKLGTSFVALTLNGTLLGIDHDESVELSDIMKGKQIIVAELYNTDSNGDAKYAIYGETNGLDLTGGGSRTGAEAASLQGYELTWTGTERNYARFAQQGEIVKGTDPVNGDYLAFSVISGPASVVATYDDVAGEVTVTFDSVTDATQYDINHVVDDATPIGEADVTSPFVVPVIQTAEIQKFNCRVQALTPEGWSDWSYAVELEIPAL